MHLYISHGPSREQIYAASEASRPREITFFLKNGGKISIFCMGKPKEEDAVLMLEGESSRGRVEVTYAPKELHPQHGRGIIKQKTA